MNRWRVIRTANLMSFHVVDRNRVRVRYEDGKIAQWKSYEAAKAYADTLNDEWKRGAK